MDEGHHEDDGRRARERVSARARGYPGIPPSQISPSKMPTAYLLVPPRRGRRGPPVLLAARKWFSNRQRDRDDSEAKNSLERI